MNLAVHLVHDTGTPVTLLSLTRIAYGALVALEYGNSELAARLLADILAEAAESGAWDGAACGTLAGHCSPENDDKRQ